ncbi:4-(cytidine 5'-diphospho)-2-C-methyl-D-erythritol kinase [Chryseomicrobium sp. FSL W7-1435]|uniref:4-(cytidine 5'-diphospho)-2-C-methyl-D-erythritol kinase n=1 Tax=Chryseomicrobium sp. FSL W7-1435 TaxID=2921704 RepID=UPI00315AFAA2
MYFVKAPAKINLTLDTLYKRQDGYHEVEMIMTTVDLYDRIGLEAREDGVIEIVSVDRFIPNDAKNLAYQAADLLKKKYGVTQGVSITIEKMIPVAAGLAGGSSDAAATLRGLNHVWSLGLTLDELAELGAEIGSDVPFCVYGGTALATGRGEKIEHLPSPSPCWVILAKPIIGVSTAEIYGQLDLTTAFHPDTKGMIKAIEDKNFQAMVDGLGNTLEGVTLSLYPEVKELKEQMKRFGAEGVLMSGSGPTVFGIVQQESRAQRVVNALRGFCDEVYCVRLLGDRE